MRCKYCFYANIAENREVAGMGIMPPETTEALVKSAFEALSPRGQISFAFQGGEPTLAGIEYFRGFVKLVRKHAPAGVAVHFSLQTNGLTLDEDWASFLHENGFLVGVSVDGDKALHDSHRVDSAQKGTFNRVVKNLGLLQKHNVDVNLLCVVSGQCARRPQRVYSALKKLGVRHLQFIPCLDPIDEKRGSKPYSLTPREYANFLCILFNEWYRDWEQGRYVGIRLFEDYVQLAMGLPPSTCATSGNCGSYLVVEGDGSLYPCDFYVLDEWRLGNINEISPLAALESPLSKRFLNEGSIKPDSCAACRWVQLCNGGCKRDHCSDSSLKNYYCAAFSLFFERSAERIAHVARLELQHRQRAVRP